MPINTALTSLLDIDHPILLAPMAGVAGGALAAAVSHAGGLGFVGGGYGERDWLVRELQAAGNAPIGIGFITWSLRRTPELLDLALAHRPKAIFLSFGEIDDLAPKIRQFGTPLIAQVQSVTQARKAVRDGADIIVAQGTEAGGHGASRATLPLVPAVADAVGKDVPVLAAGGIADGRGLAAALMLGAAGAVCGSVFYTATESLAHGNSKRAAIAASGDDTIRSSVIDVARDLAWPAPWTIRTVKNAFIAQWHHDLDGLRRNAATEQPRYAAARDQGDPEVSPAIVGEAADLIDGAYGAEEIVRRIAADAEARLRAAPQMLG